MYRIKIFSWNANGIKNKLGELIEFLGRLKIDNLLVNETKLTSIDSLKIKNYTCLRKDRENAAGSVAIFIKNYAFNLLVVFIGEENRSYF